ncbi:MAG: acetyl-CoA carboxylase biotin carboxyl carrier protein subunit [Clostridia bacterium]|nr:acetyl-CoA carboxylase biotin carboxyl carrier protein subunit [Clostridia bacterium]
MAGILVSFAKSVGESFEAGEEVATFESMKMQIPVLAPEPGRVTELLAEPGSFVDEGEPLLRYE